MNKVFLILLLSLPFVMSLVGCEGDTIVKSPSNLVEGIQITGTGSAFGEPDVAVLNLGVSVEKSSVREARDEAAAVMQKMIASLKANGVLDKDVQTQQFSVQPQIVFEGRQPVIRGYLVTNIVSIKVRNIAKSGEIIDGVVEVGGDPVRVNSISFEIDDPSKLQAQARIEAMKDAQAKAESLAKQGGIKLGKPISISENIGFVPPPIFFDKAAVGRAEVATPIQPGQLKITITVSVIYDIE